MSRDYGATWTAFMSSSGFLAAMAHFGWGCWIVLFGATWIDPWCACLAFLMFWAVPKEFIFDLAAWGEGDTWQDSLTDFCMYFLGAALAVALYYLKGTR